MSKSSHDIDWLRWIVASPCKAVSSFGSLFHFNKKINLKELVIDV